MIQTLLNHGDLDPTDAVELKAGNFRTPQVAHCSMFANRNGPGRR